jgi:ligand-binding sensor domain-containing protein
LEPNEYGDLIYHSLSQYLPDKYQNFTDVWKIHIILEGIYFQSTELIIRFQPNMLKQGKKTEDCLRVWKPENKILLSTVVDDKLYMTIKKEGLYYIKADSLKSLPKKHNYYINNAVQFKKKKWLLITYNQGTLFHFPIDSFSINKNFELHNEYKTINYSFSKLTKNNLAFGTVKNGLFITNTQGDIIHAIDKTQQLSDLMVLDIFLSEKQMLWLGTGNGITKIEYNTPIRFWNEINGFDGAVQVIIKHKGKIFIGTTIGVYQMIEPDKPGGIEKFKQIEGIRPQIWSFHEHIIEETDEKILLCGSGTGLYTIVDAKAKQLFGTSVIGTICPLSDASDVLLLSLKSGVGIIRYEDGNWNYLGNIPDFNYQIKTIAIDSNGYLWVSTNYKGVAKIKFNYESGIKGLSKEMFNITMYDTLNGLQQIKRNKIFAIKDEIAYATPNGLYKFNEKTDSFKLDINFGEKSEGSNCLSILIKRCIFRINLFVSLS